LVFLKPALRLAVASRAYLDRFGFPNHPNDLQTHMCLTQSAEPIWRFIRDAEAAFHFYRKYKHRTKEPGYEPGSLPIRINDLNSDRRVKQA
jgi:hypothetical protein